MKTFKQLISFLQESAGHWITINAPKDKKDPDKHGSHIFIDKDGKVLSGAGGALTGTKLSKIKSKSKEVSHTISEPKTEPKTEPKKDNEVWLYSDARSYEKKLKDFEQAKNERIGDHVYSDDINQKLWYAQTELDDEIRKWQRILTAPGIDSPKKEQTEDNISAAYNILNAIVEQRKYWKQRFAKEISAAADALSETAQTKLEHKKAAELHKRARYAQHSLMMGDTSTWADAEKLAQHHREKSEEHEKTFKSLKRKEKLGATLAKKREAKEREAKGELLPHEKFHPKSIQEIQQHFLTNHGLSIADASLPSGDAEYKQKRDTYLASKFDKNISNEERMKISHEWNKINAEYNKYRASRIQGFHPVNMTNSNNNQVKGIKHLLTFVENSLNNLKSRGFDIDTVLRDQNIKYACGNVTGRPAGIAWGREWSLSLKILNEYNNFNIKKNEEKRALAGQVVWGVSGTAETQEEYAQLVIVHELAHAIGIRQKSPERLDAILRRMYPKFQERKAWIKTNISEYGTTNINETDAELCSRVLHKDYVPGTFPKELEDHVYQLFKKKQ